MNTNNPKIKLIKVVVCGFLALISLQLTKFQHCHVFPIDPRSCDAVWRQHWLAFKWLINSSSVHWQQSSDLVIFTAECSIHRCNYTLMIGTDLMTSCTESLVAAVTAFNTPQCVALSPYKSYAPSPILKFWCTSRDLSLYFKLKDPECIM